MLIALAWHDKTCSTQMSSEPTVYAVALPND